MSYNRQNVEKSLTSGIPGVIGNFLLVSGLVLLGFFNAVLANQETPDRLENGKNWVHSVDFSGDSHPPFPFAPGPESDPENPDEPEKNISSDDDSSRWALESTLPEFRTETLTKETLLHCAASFHHRRMRHLYLLHHSWKHHLS
ncbi:hypothetical protein SAMN04488057_10516 [Cyclobacterium lianum]|uniref:Uncharacterized protein n=1 Tax=Cyclobacterium lianum TaxID=388280 RepID=A0A1M7N2L5_9BACT|nr:hypothetical protein [Cyclobacterium lianum]SHM97658.1 hypothetical protein SAMN04488057_10516 [Cyclobacterium lianum]